MKYIPIIVSTLVLGILFYCIFNNSGTTKKSPQVEEINTYKGAIQTKRIEGNNEIQDLQTTVLGQKQIAEAKAKKIEEQGQLNKSIEEGEAMILKVKASIVLMSDDLEVNRKGNKISENEYISKKAQIVSLEEKLRVLNDKLIHNEE